MIKHKGFKKRDRFLDIKFKNIDRDGFDKKRICIRIGAFAVILILLFGGAFVLKTVKSSSGSVKKINRNEYIVLKEGKSINTDYFTGEIKTGDYINVSGESLNSVVTEVNVSLGDEVKAGDVLGKVNSEDAENTIEELKKKKNIQLSKKNKLLEQRKMDYDAAVQNMNEDTNAEIVTAKRTVENAEDFLNKAKEAFDISQQQYTNGEITQDVADADKLKYETAQKDYELAKLQLENIRRKLQKAADDAKKVYELQKMEAGDSTEDDEIQKKEEELEKYVLKSPIDGVVIDIEAEVGKSANGVLFKIQNIDSQMVDIYIKDSDIDELEIGQTAVIQSMLTGKHIMTGVLTNIEPISNILYYDDDNKTNLKDKNIMADASYVGQILVDEFKDVLKDETTVKVQVTTDDRENIFRVPLSDIITEDGENYIYSAQQQGEEYVVEKLKITVGKKSNFDAEISGDGIAEGIIVLNNPQNYQPGLKIKMEN